MIQTEPVPRAHTAGVVEQRTHVTPSRASYWPGRVTCPNSEYSVKPGDFSPPINRNDSTPLRMIDGTLAIVSTSLITVGQP